ncbi:hypothetical protein F4808DRAFT_300514 [Astrocystis sublimbata]|nr:hypothetical protein F4808DRAFT_300514 [Astrocystis sublimbata]
MESTTSRQEARERLHRRALSQASTASSTMMHSPKTTKSSNTSSSHPRTTTPANGPPALRYYSSHGDRESTGSRHAPRLSRESSGESKRAMTPVSSLLQERLQQERRAESERLASRSRPDMRSSLGDIRDGGFSASPSRRNKTGTERRPGSSNDDDGSQSSMGAKQIEKAVSTLHKQNFDLKLELFHRREKQSTLENRVEELETERREMNNMHEHILSELDQRDKAIEEAVNMIVKLEARVDELVQEKEMMRELQVDGPYRQSWSEISDSLRAETPKPGDGGSLSVEPRTLERMPSFLSDQSAHTQHLRNIVLQNRASLRHLRKFSEVSSSSADVSEVNRIASPSVSLLSESSFVSIYGSKSEQDDSGFLPLGDALGMDGTFGERSPTPTMKAMNCLSTQMNNALGRTPHLARPASCLPGQARLMSNASQSGSPTQKREIYSGQNARYGDDHFRPSTTGRRGSAVTPTLQFMGSPSQPPTRRERSHTLQKVMTNYPSNSEAANAHPLPPTPDTVSSMVLRKHKDQSSSQDSLPRSDDAHGSRHLANPLPHGNEYLRSLASQEPRYVMTAQKIAPSAVPKTRSALPSPGFVKVDQDALLSHLANSAANNNGFGRRRDSFVSDSDSEGGADAHSDTESCDYWLRESLKPDKENRRASRRHEIRRSPSPDLFSFPADSEGWQPDAMFGALRGAGFLGSPDPALKRDPVDELAASLNPPEVEVETTQNLPQPPSRRSSLNSHVAGHFLLSSFKGKTGKSSSRENGGGGGNVLQKVDPKGRRNSVGTTVDAAAAKKSQYPPISGLQSRARGLGLNSLFRRSGSESHAAAPLSATESNFPPSVSGSQQQQQGHRVPSGIPPAQLRHLQFTKPAGRSSVPPPPTMPWAAPPLRPHSPAKAHPARALTFEDDFASATPPPIMRNRPAPIQVELANSEVTDGFAVTPTVAPPSSGGGMRHWLGLEKMAKLKNRAG